MTDRMVQVPASVVEAAARHLDREGYHGTATLLRDALLSQPEASGEAVSPLCLFGHDVFTAGGYCRRCGASMVANAEPPRVEDMAPGTTFRDNLGVVYLRMSPRKDGFDFTDSRGYFWFAYQIDPSTIRDVRPPA